MFYGFGSLAVDRKIEQRMSVAEIRTLRWMSGVMGEDRIGNKYVRGSIGVTLIADKMWDDLGMSWGGRNRKR